MTLFAECVYYNTLDRSYRGMYLTDEYLLMYIKLLAMDYIDKTLSLSNMFVLLFLV